MVDIADFHYRPHSIPVYSWYHFRYRLCVALNRMEDQQQPHKEAKVGYISYQ